MFTLSGFVAACPKISKLEKHWKMVEGEKKTVIEILEHENRLLYYNYNQIPTINKSTKKITIN